MTITDSNVSAFSGSYIEPYRSCTLPDNQMATVSLVLMLSLRSDKTGATVIPNILYIFISNDALCLQRCCKS